jgi:hypothetical protein
MQQPSWSPRFTPQSPPSRLSFFMKWWFRFTAPDKPPADASLAQHELYRRARFTSLALIVMVVLAIAFPTSALINHNYVLFAGWCVGLVMTLVALRQNRKGNITAAGLIVIAWTMSGQALAVESYGMQLFTMPLFDLFIISELLAISFLAPGFVFLVGTTNCIIMLTLFLVSPHAPDLQHVLLQHGAFYLLARPIVLQIVVALVTYLWSSSATKAIVRADRAEVIAQLEHMMAELEHTAAQQKRILDQSIQVILETHLQVANGDYSARVPLTGDNVLWPLAGNLNTLLARITRLGREEQRLHETERAAEQLAAALRALRTGSPPIPLWWSGTVVDRILLELNTMPQESTPM